MTPRCPRCSAPGAHCFCAEIPEVRCRLRVVIVRHVAERKKVSNTGGLTARVIGARLVDHGAPGGPTDLGDLGPSPHLLFTPGRTGDWPDVSTLVVLDGTWGQVRAMRARVPGLPGVPALALPAAPAARRMRVQHRAEGLSTLEAVAAALDHCGEPEPAAALRVVFARATSLWLRLRRRSA